MFFNRDLTESEDFYVTIKEYSDSAPVTAAQVKSYLNYSGSGQDTEILRMIKSAVRQVEKFTGSTVVEKTYYVLWKCVGQRTLLVNGPLISIDSVITTGSTLTTNDYHTNGDYLYATRILSTVSLDYTEPYLECTYKAGFLRPVSVTSDVITLVGHGYSDGDEVGLYGITGATEGTLYTVESATADTFEIGETLTDGEGFVGVIDPLFIEGIIMQSAENFLRGEASAGLSRKVMNHIYSLKRQVMY